jgi:hypothetical protein
LSSKKEEISRNNNKILIKMNSNEEDEFEVGAGIKSINLMAEKDQLTNTNSSKADLEKNLKMLDGIGKNLALKNKIENQRKSD